MKKPTTRPEGANAPALSEPESDPATVASVVRIALEVISDKVRRGVPVQTSDGATGPQLRRRLTSVLMQARCGLSPDYKRV